MLKGFKDFLLRGNVVDLAVAVVIGAAFTAIVTAFTSNIINPLVAAVGGSNEYGFGFLITDSPESFVNIGAVITAIINFLIIAAVVYFVLIVPVNAAKTRFDAKKETEASTAEDSLSDQDILIQIRDLLADGRPTAGPGNSSTGAHER
ncbi:large conductance mechanosensitive channel protein MscL [Actinomycetes bacterium M1A6_2h]